MYIISNDYPIYRSLHHDVHHLEEEADIVAGPEAVPEGKEEHGDGKGGSLAAKPLQTRVDIPERDREQDKQQYRHKLTYFRSNFATAKLLSIDNRARQPYPSPLSYYI
jgi:hypothetical protein